MCSFVLLKGASHMALAGRGGGPSAATQEGCMQANGPVSATRKDPLAVGDRGPLLKLILVCLFSM